MKKILLSISLLLVSPVFATTFDFKKVGNIESNEKSDMSRLNRFTTSNKKKLSLDNCIKGIFPEYAYVS